MSNYLKPEKKITLLQRKHVEALLKNTPTMMLYLHTAEADTLRLALAQELATDKPRRVIAQRLFGRLSVLLHEDMLSDFNKALNK